MSIWFWKARGRNKGDYYSISLPLLFPVIGVCACVIIMAATLYPAYCLLGGGVIIAIVIVLHMRYIKNKGGGKDSHQNWGKKRG